MFYPNIRSYIDLNNNLKYWNRIKNFTGVKLYQILNQSIYDLLSQSIFRISLNPRQVESRLGFDIWQWSKYKLQSYKLPSFSHCPCQLNLSIEAFRQNQVNYQFHPFCIVDFGWILFVSPSLVGVQHLCCRVHLAFQTWKQKATTTEILR